MHAGRFHLHVEHAVPVDHAHPDGILGKLAVIRHMHRSVIEILPLIFAEINRILVFRNVAVAFLVVPESDNASVGKLNHGIAVIVDEVFLMRDKEHETRLRQLL